MGCVYCNGTKLKVVKRRITNGTFQVFVQCQGCGRNARGGGHFLPQKNVDLDTIPLVEDYTADAPPCEVKACDEHGVQYHHSAPRHLFGDECERWPMCYLCRKHHREWHSIVTPDMTKQREDN